MAVVYHSTFKINFLSHTSALLFSFILHLVEFYKACRYEIFFIIYEQKI